MRRPHRLIAAIVAAALCSVLAGCGGGGMGSFDPSDLLDFLDTKKKLPGDRRPVFPEGVPGLEQGVPRDMYRGSRQEQIDQQNVAAPAVPPPEEPRPQRAAKGKGRQAVDTAPAVEPVDPADDPASLAEEGAPADVPPPPKPKKISRKRITAPPPDPAEPAAASAAPAPPPQRSAAPFPAPLPSGSFTR